MATRKAKTQFPEWNYCRSLGKKTKQRTFRLINAIDTDTSPPYWPGPYQAVNEVIRSIENDTLMVVNYEDDDALDAVVDDAGVEVLDHSCVVPVSIREWLPLGCQIIRFGNPGPEGVTACYQNNAYAVLFAYGDMPFEDLWPLGPDAFLGEVLIRREKRWTNVGPDWAKHEDAFKFVVAHELTHVFDMLRLLVPAFRNWPAFWKHVLHSGTLTRGVMSLYNDMSLFVDDYGGENERGIVSQYWPSQADKWFSAFRQPSKHKTRRKRKGAGK